MNEVNKPIPVDRIPVSQLHQKHIAVWLMKAAEEDPRFSHATNVWDIAKTLNIVAEETENGFVAYVPYNMEGDNRLPHSMMGADKEDAVSRLSVAQIFGDPLFEL